MRHPVAETMHRNGAGCSMVARRKRESIRRRNYVALGSSPSTPSSPSSVPQFSSLMSKRRHWSSWMFVITLVAFQQASLCLAKEDDKKRRSTPAPTFAPTPLPTTTPTSLPTTRPTPVPTERRNEKNNDKDANNGDKDDEDRDEPEFEFEETDPPIAVPVAQPAAAVPVAPPSAVIVATSPPTLPPVAPLRTTMAPITPVIFTSAPVATPPTVPPVVPAVATSGPSWWRRPTPEPMNPSSGAEVARPTADPALTLDKSDTSSTGSSSNNNGGTAEETPSLFTEESRTIAIPPITVVFEFLPQVVAALQVSPAATGTTTAAVTSGGYDGRRGRHLNDKKQRLQVAMERELIHFLTMILETNTAQGDALTSTDLSVTISYEGEDVVSSSTAPASGAAFVSGTATFTGQAADELPTEASLHENLVLYFQFWGAGNLLKHLVDNNIDVARVMVLIDGLRVGSSDDAKDLPGDNGRPADETNSGEMPPSDSSAQHDDDETDDSSKASLFAGLSMGFMLVFVIVVTVLFLRHRKDSTTAAQMERDQRSAASFPTKVARTPPERIGSPMALTMSNSSQECHNHHHLQHDPADESLSSSSAASGVVVNMTSFHELKHQEWDAHDEEPMAVMGSTPPCSSLGHNESEKDAFDDVDIDDEEEANSHNNDSIDGSSLFTGSVVTVQSSIMPPPRGALRSSAFQYDPSRLATVISSARVYTREIDNTTITSGDSSAKSSSDKSGDRKSF